MKSSNPFKNLKLDAEEREIERGIKAGEWKPSPKACPTRPLRQVFSISTRWERKDGPNQSSIVISVATATPKTTLFCVLESLS